jgi:hypothetical protein
VPDTGLHVSVVLAEARSGIRLRREDPGLWLMLAGKHGARPSEGAPAMPLMPGRAWVTPAWRR